MKDFFKSHVIWIITIGAILLFHFFGADNIEPYYLAILMYAGINVILAVSLNLVNGFTGQFSMGHAGFMAVGAYVSALTTTYFKTNNLQLFEAEPWHFAMFLGALLLGGFIAAIIGYLVGLPTLRLRGDYLAIVTLGFGEIIRVAFLNIEVTGGARGFPNIPPISSFAWVYIWAAITIYVVRRIVVSSEGRALLAVREDEIAAEASGVNTTKAKVKAFAVGAFFAGIAGGLFAHYLAYLNPQIFDFNRSVEIIIMVVLGGMGSISGSVFAAMFLSILRESLRTLQQLTGTDYRMIIYAVLLIVLMLTRPNGIFGTREIIDYLPKRIQNKFFKGRVTVTVHGVNK